MVRFLVLSFVCLGPTLVYGQVYTWTDEQGRTHYGDHPPQAQQARQLEIDTQNVSTVGDSGLRPGELALLEQIRQDERKRAELRRQRLELARIEEQNRQAELELANTLREESELIETKRIHYPLAYPYSANRSHLQSSRDKVRFRLRAQFGNRLLEINPPMRHRGRAAPYRERDREYRQARISAKPMFGVRHGIAE